MAPQSCQACQARSIQQQICPCNLRKPMSISSQRNYSEDVMGGIPIGVPVQPYSNCSNRDLSGSREIANRMLMNFPTTRANK